jgi:hypothetical protein
LRVDPGGRIDGRAVIMPEASCPRTIGAWILKIPFAPWE